MILFVVAGVMLLIVVLPVAICARKREPPRRRVIARGWRGWNWNEELEWE